jgi:hypothetical protein
MKYLNGREMDPLEEEGHFLKNRPPVNESCKGIFCLIVGCLLLHSERLIPRRQQRQNLNKMDTEKRRSLLLKVKIFAVASRQT